MIFTRFKMDSRVNAMVTGALAGSAKGLMHRGDELRYEVPDASVAPTGGWYFHPENAWSSILEPAFVAAISLQIQPQIYCMATGGRSPDHDDTIRFSELFAGKLLTWSREGFRAWHDARTPYRLNPQIAATTRIDDYVRAPLIAANSTPIIQYECEPIAYALVAALAPTVQVAISLTALLSAASVQSGRNEAVLVAAILHTILHGGRRPEMAVAIQSAKACIAADVWKNLREAMGRAAGQHPLRDTGGRDNGGSAIATFQVFFWIVGCYLNNTMPTWEEAIGLVCQQGGASDINCALVGAVYGAARGPSILPTWASKVNHIEWACEQMRAVVTPSQSS